MVTSSAITSTGQTETTRFEHTFGYKMEGEWLKGYQKINLRYYFNEEEIKMATALMVSNIV